MEDIDFKKIKRVNFNFNWGSEKKNQVFKLSIEGEEEILGLMSLIHFEQEQRIEINLLAASKTNIGQNKIYDRIAGNLIAYACRECVKLHPEYACVSLIPKTDLRQHYVDQYGMIDDGGYHLYLEGISLYQIINNFDIWNLKK
ncbi:MAG: N-acetyltransferase [Flavobacterium sp. JAD_PAG50586_2]|nr:MAG: N-acetyltransferase [Flavobacterium sp. JAD_PAG50586_2]